MRFSSMCYYACDVANRVNGGLEKQCVSFVFPGKEVDITTLFIRKVMHLLARSTGGSLIFFDEEKLRDSVVLDPYWLAEADLKYLILEQYEDASRIFKDGKWLPCLPLSAGPGLSLLSAGCCQHLQLPPGSSRKCGTGKADGTAGRKRTAFCQFHVSV